MFVLLLSTRKETKRKPSGRQAEERAPTDDDVLGGATAARFWPTPPAEAPAPRTLHTRFEIQKRRSGGWGKEGRG